MLSVPPFFAPSAQAPGPVDGATRSHAGAAYPFASVLRRIETAPGSDPDGTLPQSGDQSDVDALESRSIAPLPPEDTPLDLPDGSFPSSGLQADPWSPTQIEGSAGDVGGERPESSATGVAVRAQGEEDSVMLSAQSVMRGMDRQQSLQNVLPKTSSAAGTRPMQAVHEASTASGTQPNAPRSEAVQIPDTAARHSQKTGASQSSASIIPFAEPATVAARDGAKALPRHTVSAATPTERTSANNLGPDVVRTTNVAPTVAIPTASTPIVTPAQLPQSEIPIELGVGSMASTEARAASGEPNTLASSPPTARQIVQQVGMAITQTSNGTTEITLNPEELGRVRLTVSQADTGPTVIITAERQDVLDLMRRHAGSLGQDLAQAGLGHATFTFGGGDQQGDESQSAQQSLVDDKEDFQPSASSSFPVGSGLDLRL